MYRFGAEAPKGAPPAAHPAAAVASHPAVAAAAASHPAVAAVVASHPAVKAMAPAVAAKATSTAKQVPSSAQSHEVANHPAVIAAARSHPAVAAIVATHPGIARDAPHVVHEATNHAARGGFHFHLPHLFGHGTALASGRGALRDPNAHWDSEAGAQGRYGWSGGGWHWPWSRPAARGYHRSWWNPFSWWGGAVVENVYDQPPVDGSAYDPTDPGIDPSVQGLGDGTDDDSSASQGNGQVNDGEPTDAPDADDGTDDSPTG
jgi:hypothetical protein